MPVYSMTGYANASGGPESPGPAAFHEAGGKADSTTAAHLTEDVATPPSTTRVNVEIRSVNSRFLDLVFKLPDELRHVEPQLRELVTARFKRGKIELRLSSQAEGHAAVQGPDVAQLDRLAQMEARVISRLKHANKLSVYEALLLCKSSSNTPAENLDAAAVDATRLCAERLADSRAREGARLAAILLGGVQRLRELATQAEPLVPAAVQRQQARFLERWSDALAASGGAGGSESVSREASQERALNEAAAYAIRIDVAEELARLRSHLEEIARLVERGGEIGKRLDFLIQELLREANTLASKSSSLDMTGISVDMKVAIEQLREQVQNIE